MNLQRRIVVGWDGTEEGIPAWAKAAGWTINVEPAWQDESGFNFGAYVTATFQLDDRTYVAYRGDAFVRHEDGRVRVLALYRGIRQAMLDSEVGAEE